MCREFESLGLLHVFKSKSRFQDIQDIQVMQQRMREPTNLKRIGLLQPKHSRYLSLKSRKSRFGGVIYPVQQHRASQNQVFSARNKSSGPQCATVG